MISLSQKCVTFWFGYTEIQALSISKRTYASKPFPDSSSERSDPIICCRTSGAITLKMGYGYEVEEGSDPIVKFVDEALDAFDNAAIPGSFLVDILPACPFSQF